MIEGGDKFIDCIGSRCGMLTVIEEYPFDDTKVICKCDCGNTVTRSKDSIRKKVTESCGCMHHRRIGISNRTHGESGGKYEGKRTRLYRCWTNMKSRCYNEKVRSYADYGAKGIRVCDEWHDFAKFSEWAHNSGYDDSLTIERRNPDGDYCPENCEWISPGENSRRAHMKPGWALNLNTGEYVEFQCARDFANERGLNDKCIHLVMKGANKTHKGWVFGRLPQ